MTQGLALALQNTVRRVGDCCDLVRQIAARGFGNPLPWKVDRLQLQRSILPEADLAE